MFSIALRAEVPRLGSCRLVGHTPRFERMQRHTHGEAPRHWQKRETRAASASKKRCAASIKWPSRRVGRCRTAAMPRCQMKRSCLACWLCWLCWLVFAGGRASYHSLVSLSVVSFISFFLLCFFSMIILLCFFFLSRVFCVYSFIRRSHISFRGRDAAVRASPSDIPLARSLVRSFVPSLCLFAFERRTARIADDRCRDTADAVTHSWTVGRRRAALRASADRRNAFSGNERRDCGMSISDMICNFGVEAF